MRFGGADRVAEGARAGVVEVGDVIDGAALRAAGRLLGEALRARERDRGSRRAAGRARGAGAPGRAAAAGGAAAARRARACRRCRRRRWCRRVRPCLSFRRCRLRPPFPSCRRAPLLPCRRFLPPPCSLPNRRRRWSRPFRWPRRRSSPPLPTRCRRFRWRNCRRCRWRPCRPSPRRWRPRRRRFRDPGRRRCPPGRRHQRLPYTRKPEAQTLP